MRKNFLKKAFLLSFSRFLRRTLDKAVGATEVKVLEKLKETEKQGHSFDTGTSQKKEFCRIVYSSSGIGLGIATLVSGLIISSTAIKMIGLGIIFLCTFAFCFSIGGLVLSQESSRKNAKFCKSKQKKWRKNK